MACGRTTGRLHLARRPRALVAAAALPALLLGAVPALSQDGMLLPRRSVASGVVFTHESWDRYWEGRLKRDNENIGTLSTRSVAWMVGVGLTDRLTLAASLPYVSTDASQGTLRGMRGVQDLSLALRYGVLSNPIGELGTASLTAGIVAGTPVTDYTPDFLPLSIGLGSRRVAARLAMTFEADAGWYAALSGGHTWRGNVTLDRPHYYTNGRLYLTDQVAMPRVVDYMVAAGFRAGRLDVPVSITRQRTLGGSDIRRQDMPFVSNRMDFLRADASVGYALPRANTSLRLGAGRVLDGRNVGQGTSVSAGVHYLLPF